MAQHYFDRYAEYEPPKLEPIMEGNDDDEDYHPCKSHRTDRLRVRLAPRDSPELVISDYSESGMSLLHTPAVCPTINLFFSPAISRPSSGIQGHLLAL